MHPHVSTDEGSARGRGETVTEFRVIVSGHARDHAGSRRSALSTSPSLDFSLFLSLSLSLSPLSSSRRMRASRNASIARGR
jgi:hypothetical protein